MGPTAAMVPTDVPVDMDIKHEIINMPAVMNCGGIMDRAKFTVDSTPPIAPDTSENAPARI